jgi:DNA-binding NarL/FixJ family response regulator
MLSRDWGGDASGVVPSPNGEPVTPASGSAGGEVADGLVRVVVSDDELVWFGVETALRGHRSTVEVVGGPVAGGDAFEVAAALSADILLLGIGRPSVRTLDPVAELMAKSPPFRVVIFTEDEDEALLFAALRLGVSGFLLKSIGGAQLADHLDRVARGEVVVDPTLATRVAMGAAHRANGTRAWPGFDLGLSRRESEVLELLAEGLSNRLIASKLTVGEETVKTHLRSIYRKLGVTDRAQAVALALRKGIVS